MIQKLCNRRFLIAKENEMSTRSKCEEKFGDFLYIFLSLFFFLNCHIKNLLKLLLCLLYFPKMLFCSVIDKESENVRYKLSYMLHYQ